MTQINKEQARKVEQLLKGLPADGSGLNFYSFGEGDKKIVAIDMYPELRHPQAVNFFFFVGLHEFGFWHGDWQGYAGQFYGLINGKSCKGSDLLWKVAKRALDNDETCFEPWRLAKVKYEELTQKIFVDDNGPIPFPNLEIRFALTRHYGQWMAHLGMTPGQIVAMVNQSREPLRYFLEQVGTIPGYDQDEMEKKNVLLAMMLANRPERFLLVKDPQNWHAIIDYHLMRVCLRLGLVELGSREKKKNQERRWISSNLERRIRWATYVAVESLIQESGLSMFFIDKVMWMARKYCPEMEKPDCGQCIFTDVCRQRVELFQPIFRTTAY